MHIIIERVLKTDTETVGQLFLAELMDRLCLTLLFYQGRGDGRRNGKVVDCELSNNNLKRIFHFLFDEFYLLVLNCIFRRQYRVRTVHNLQLLREMMIKFNQSYRTALTCGDPSLSKKSNDRWRWCRIFKNTESDV